MASGREASRQERLPSIEQVEQSYEMLDPFTLGTDQQPNTKPRSRRQIYSTWEAMERDPSIAEALGLHVAAALGGHESRSELVYMVPAPSIRGGGKRAKDLRQKVERRAKAMNTEMNRVILPACRHAVAYGDSYARVYAREKTGVYDLLCADETKPPLIQAFEQGGRTIGFHVLENPYENRVLTKLTRMQMARLKMPRMSPIPQYDPIRLTDRRQNLQEDDRTLLPIVAAKVGGSLLYEAEIPWQNVNLALSAMNSQQVADAVEHAFLTMDMSGMPQAQQQKYKKGLQQTLQTHRNNIRTAMQGGETLWAPSYYVLPTWSEKQVVSALGELSQRTGQINPETFMINVRRMMGGMGIDISMVGWMDMLAGGLGDGAAFHTSAQIMRRSQWIRGGATDFLNHIADLDWWYCYGEAFSPQDRPWTFEFYSDQSAAMTEAISNKQNRFNTLAVLAQSLGALRELNLGDQANTQLLESIGGLDHAEAEKLAKAMGAAPAAEGEQGQPSGNEQPQGEPDVGDEEPEDDSEDGE